jgi:flagellar biosynthesis protein FlhB
MSEDSGEKTFAPSAKRRRDAARRGDVVRSRELGTAAAMLCGFAWLSLAGPWLLGNLQHGLRTAFTFDRQSLDQFAPGMLVQSILITVLPPILLLGIGVMIAAGGSQLLLGEGRFLPGNLAPKPSRLNPLSGFKRIIGVQGLVELGKSILKVGLLGAIAWWWSRSALGGAIGLARAPLETQLSEAWRLLLSLLFMLSVGLAVIAFIDLPVQLIRRFVRLKMSQQDVRDEHKESEGSPEKKAAIRQRQRQIAAGGVQRAVREAQFLITNPTQFAVAITYDPALAGAPVVLAKGQGEKALAMRELATEYGVPMLEYPLLARSVYYTTRENQVIREELYAAIATVLAFVLSLKRPVPLPRPIVDVPSLLRFDADGRADPLARA